MENRYPGFEEYSRGLNTAFGKHSGQIAILCLMKNHSVWKISFGVLLRYIQDFRKMKNTVYGGSEVLVGLKKMMTKKVLRCLLNGTVL